MSLPSLKQAQVTAVVRMLAMNKDTTDNQLESTTSSGTTYNQRKILIYDKPCRSIISPLLSVSQLRSRGVTLHLLLSSDRDAISDAPAVYFIEPTRTNLAIIAQDCASGIYQRAHLNFVSRLDRGLMEEFARLVIQSGPDTLGKVASVHDQYLDYVCLERNIFTLNRTESYVTYNNSGATERSMDDAMSDVAAGLFSVVATLGRIPVVRCPRGGAPEMVARKLSKMIADHPTLSRSTGLQSHQRPLLVIMDRNSDLITPVQHTSTYQALVDDLLDHTANRVEFDSNASGDGGRARSKNSRKRFDLDPDDDPFYSRYKFNPFPEAIESNGAELQEVTMRTDEIKSKAGGGGADVASGRFSAASGDQTSAATELASAVDSLPALLERKRQLEMHTSILQAVMNEVAARDVPQFFELESSLATGRYSSDLATAKQVVTNLVTDPTKGNIDDKIRLILVFCLTTTAPSSDIDEVAGLMKTALETKGLAQKDEASAASASRPGEHGTLNREEKAKLEQGLKSIDYIKRLRSMQMIPMMSEAMHADADASTSDARGGASDILSGFMARATNQATGLLAKATEKVGSMLGKVYKQPATRVVENLCEMKPGTEDEEYLYLDPKVRGDIDISALRNMTRAPVREVITFMVGGGCYAEYQNLQMVANEQRTICYGCTELVDPCVFLKQLSKLA